MQQCIQISTRISLTSVHTYSCVCFIRNVSNIQQGEARVPRTLLRSANGEKGKRDIHFGKVFCLSNRKFERFGGPLDEIVTVFVHKYNVIMPHPDMTSLIRETGCQDVGCFIFFLSGNVIAQLHRFRMALPC